MRQLFDKITIEDEYKKLRLTLTRRRFTDPAPWLCTIGYRPKSL